MTTRRSVLLFAGMLCTALSTVPDANAADASVSDSGRDASPDAAGRVDAAVDASGGANDASKPAVDAGLVAPKFIVGAQCETTKDCAKGLICTPQTAETFNGAGPAGGLCTLDCSKNGQSDCDSVDTGSFCVTFDEAGKVAYCFERCLPGQALAGECHDRLDMACSPDTVGAPFCKPTCRGDYDCGSRKCDGLTGFCSTSTGGTHPLGSACDPAETTRSCEGACVAFPAGPGDSESSACSAYCAYGVANSCGQAPNSTRFDAACIPLTSGEALGDVGFCVQLCDCDADCSNPAYVCQPISPDVSANSPRAGACVPSATALNDHLPCGSSPDASVPDSGTPSPTQSDAGSDAGAGGAKAKSDSGCGCRVGVADAPSSSRGALFLALATALVARRRRARV